MIENSILSITDDDIVETLLFGDFKFSLEIKSSLIKALINYCNNSERFD